MTLTPQELAMIARHPVIADAAEFWAMVDDVAAAFGVTRKAIAAPQKGTPEAIEARQLVCLFASWRGYSTPQIGRYIGRDHTTVMHSIRRAALAIERNQAQNDRAGRGVEPSNPALEPANL